MASPDVAPPQANGVAALSRPDSPASSIASQSTKRKREPADEAAVDPSLSAISDSQKPTLNGQRAASECMPLIRDFFAVLERYEQPPRVQHRLHTR